ncbi:MAG: EAL domain-containing protein [Thiobacillus sp.]|nr:EAL domain-containing protein [Thiobacillus sp.]
MRLTQLDTHARILSALALVVVIVVLLAGQQALQAARQNADAVLRELAETQFASLSQAVTDAAILRDHYALQAHLEVPVARGILRYAEYTAPDGHVLRREAGLQHVERPDWFAALARLEPPHLQADIVIGGTDYGHLALQPSPHVREDFLWHLATRLFFVLAGAFALLGWLTRVLLRTNLQDLTRLRAAARRIETGDYRARIPIRAGSPPELRETTQAFNHMSAALEQLLADLNEQQAALDHTACISEADLAGNITYVNDLFCAISGFNREELIGRNHRIVNAGHHDAAFFNELWASISRGRTWRGEMCSRARDGRLFWTATTIIPIKDDDGLPSKYLSIRFDITQRKLDEAALSAEKERWQVTLQSINDAVIVTQADSRVAYINPAAEHLLGIALEEAASIPLKHLMQFDQIKSEDEGPACFLSPASAPRGQTGSVRLHTRQGQALAISYSCAPLGAHGGVGAVYVLRDETEKKQLLDSLREMAFHDPLTALPNRRAVEGRLDRAMRIAREDAQQHAFCYIDLDQFKLVNDTCGHSVGDSLLKNITQTMKEALPEQAYLGRLGGDEFGLILFDTEPRDAIEICRQLVQRIRDFRFEHNGRRFTLGACAGIAPITAAAATTSGIMIQADMACYRAKSEGSGRVMLYEADEVGFRRLEAEMGWAADFAQALEANQFLPYRQLIQPASPGGQPHYEVLIRWQRNGQIEGPAKLLPALERYGQAPILDRWMLEAVISYLASQPDDRAVYFINLSGKTVADESFLGIVCALLDRYDVAGERLGFEVTETAAVVNLEDAQRLIHGLRERGCQFALDDFGRDASSFFYLKHLPADYLKIDGAFVRGMLDDRRDQAIVRSIAQLASDFGMRSIAEQVEDADMAALLRDIGVDYLQGYHIHRPEAFPGWQAVTRLPHLTRIK